MKPIAKTGSAGYQKNKNWWLLIVVPFCFILAHVGCKKNNDQPVNVQSNLKLIADNLVSPLSVVESPDDTKRLFIVDQIGKIFIVPNGGTIMASPFFDLSAKLVAL